jgi:hypothetical protein
VSFDSDKVISIDHQVASRSGKDLKLPIRIPFKTLTSGATTLSAQVTLYYCREDNTGTCQIKTLVWSVPVSVTDATNASSQISLQGKLKE